MRARMPDPGSHQGGKAPEGISRMSKGVCWAWEIRDDWTARRDPVGRDHEPGRLLVPGAAHTLDSQLRAIPPPCICKRCGVVYVPEADHE